MDWQTERRVMVPDDPRAITVRMSRTRLVEVVLRCEGPLVGPDGAPTARIQAPTVEVVWLPGEEVWLAAELAPASSGAAPVRAVTYSDAASGQLVSSNTSRFAARLPLPLGRSLVAASGPCGFASREVTIAATADPPSRIDLTAPAPRAGTLMIQAANAGTVEVRQRGLLVARRSVTAGEPTVVPRLPAGRYDVGSSGPPSCYQRAEVQPGEVTQVALSACGADITTELGR